MTVYYAVWTSQNSMCYRPFPWNGTRRCGFWPFLVWAYLDPSTSFIGSLLKRIYLERNLVRSVLMLHQSRYAYCFVATILTAVFFSFAKITRNNYINLSSSNKVAIYFFGKMPNIGSVSFGKNNVCYGSKWFTWPSSTAVVKCHFESSDTRPIPDTFNICTIPRKNLRILISITLVQQFITASKRSLGQGNVFKVFVCPGGSASQHASQVTWSAWGGWLLSMHHRSHYRGGGVCIQKESAFRN